MIKVIPRCLNKIADHFRRYLTRGRTIIEVGGYTGSKPAMERCDRRGINLFIFEPVPELPRTLREKSDGLSRVTIIEKAVTPKRGKVEHHIADHKDCSSVLSFDD